MRVRLLGPVDVVGTGAPTPVPGLRRKAILTALALRPGEVVTLDELVDIVWGDAAPATVVNTVQAHVSLLRRLLGASGAIVTRPRGYLLDIDPDRIDAGQAETLVAQAELAGDQAGAADLAGRAVALWRGRALADLAGLAWFDGHGRRLEALHGRARQVYAAARLAQGQHTQVVPELELLCQEQPLNERVHAQLMLALYRGGRQAEALTVYHRLRGTLDEELGIGPTQELRDLEVAILRQDPHLDLPVPASRAGVAGAGTADGVPVPHGVAVPAQLPVAPAACTGRDAQLSTLDRLLVPAGSGPAALVAALSGTAGVGKTTLALHWAYRVADRFPDGQLYVNLRGFDPATPPLDPAEVLNRFLAALGVPVHRVPPDTDGRAALYRATLAGRRVLVVLDDARDAGQVRPLLPGGAGTVTLVLSRDQLVPLVVSHGAHPVPVDLLSTVDSEALLAARLGTARLAAEPGAVARIVARCAGLPLALAIVAARAAVRPHLPLGTLAAELGPAGTPDALDTLDGGDPGTDLRAVFACSYRAVSVPAARLFRLLGLHPGPDVDTGAAAGLAGVTVRQAQRLLAELARANLAGEHAPGRYAVYDLLREYAAEKCAGTDPAADRAAATARLLDHYLHGAYAAALALSPTRTPVGLDPAQPPPPVPSTGPAGYDQAAAWFAAEHQVLLAAVPLAAGAGLDGHAWRLVWAMSVYLDRNGHWHDWATAGRTALAAAQRLGDPTAQATMHRYLARAYTRLERTGDAYPHLGTALALYQRSGDQVGAAETYLRLSQLMELDGRHAEALDAAASALRLFRTAGHRPGQASALNAVGWYRALLGDHRTALVSCQRALPILQELGDRLGQADTWDSLGYIHQHLDRYHQAVTCYRTAIELYRQLGDRYDEATSLDHLGQTHFEAGRPDRAARRWRQALAILDDIGHPGAAAVRVSLDRCTVRPAARTAVAALRRA